MDVDGWLDGWMEDTARTELSTQCDRTSGMREALFCWVVKTSMIAGTRKSGLASKNRQGRDDSMTEKTNTNIAYSYPHISTPSSEIVRAAKWRNQSRGNIVAARAEDPTQFEEQLLPNLFCGTCVGRVHCDKRQALGHLGDRKVEVLLYAKSLGRVRPGG